MGIFTLDKFRILLSDAVGERGWGNTRLDLYIQLAYTEVFSHSEFEELKVCATASTVDGQKEYALPDQILGLAVLVDKTNKRILLKSDIRNFKALDYEEEGEPLRWARIANGFHLWPVPDGEYLLDVTYFKEPVGLEDGADVSILPATWDNAIYLLSAHYALAALGKEELAGAWFTRAMAYMRSRLTDVDYSAGTPAIGVTVARSYEQITEMRTWP